MNILLTCVGRRRYLVEYLKQNLSRNDLVIGADMSEDAPALELCDFWFKVPAVYDHLYIDIIFEICAKENIRALIPLNDLELPILAKHKKRFNKIGTDIIVSDISVIQVCNDKWATVKLAEELNIPTPKSFLDTKSAIDSYKQGEINFPVMIKPRWGSASFGLFIADDTNELLLFFDICSKRIKKSYLSQFAESDQSVIIQEFIQGKEYGLDIFNDLNGRCRGVVCKLKLAMRGGETDKAVTISADRFSIYARRLAEKLKHVGNLDCDFLEDNRGLFLIELNPRFGGGYPFSHEAGANLLKALIKCLDNRTDQISIQYKENMTFSKCDVLVPARENKKVSMPGNV